MHLYTKLLLFLFVYLFSFLVSCTTSLILVGEDIDVPSDEAIETDENETDENETDENETDDNDTNESDTNEIDSDTGNGQICPSDCTIVPLTQSVVARVGSVYSSTLYNPDITENNETHDPQAIKVEVRGSDGNPVVGCPVQWTLGPESGWIFTEENMTDEDGRASAWWTAGSALAQWVEASVVLSDGSTKVARIMGTAEPHETRSPVVYLEFSTDVAYEAFQLDVTPVTFPTGTYYAAINFPVGFSGLQNLEGMEEPAKRVLFTIWDSEVAPTEIVDSGEADCAHFEKESGVKCILAYNWEVGGTYRFIFELSYHVPGKTEYTLSIVDMANPKNTTLVAVLSHGESIYTNRMISYIQNFGASANSCLENLERKAYFHNARYFANGQWHDIHQGSFDATYNRDGNSICANYFYGQQDGKFLWSTGGDELVSRPLLEDEPSPIVILDKALD